ncbi:MAG: VWA domain-containing protein [Alphaproteobacteria bacterium]|nr:VWA domain-containing protein [Alphaproteobacteria bacterium]
MNEEKRIPLPPAQARQRVDAFLTQLAAVPAVRTAGPRGRLLFALDATASREAAWDRACQIQGEMFQETSALGGLDVQMLYYRGFGEFHATPWVSDSKALIGTMSGVRCLAGKTQIAQVLCHALAEARAGKVSALVFVGDCVEEDVDTLGALAGELGVRGVPAFVFQEGFEPGAERALRQVAQLSRGAWCRFDASSASQLRDLLAAVAVYAAGGRKALDDYSAKRKGHVHLLAKQLE